MSQDAPPPGQPLTERQERERLTAVLRDEYGALFDDIEALLFRHDPISINYGHNTDEYRPEVRAMLPRLDDCASAADVTRMTHEVFVQYFSADSAGAESDYAAIGDEIWALWTSEASRSYRSSRPSP